MREFKEMVQVMNPKANIKRGDWAKDQLVARNRAVKAAQALDTTKARKRMAEAAAHGQHHNAAAQ